MTQRVLSIRLYMLLRCYCCAEVCEAKNSSVYGDYAACYSCVSLNVLHEVVQSVDSCILITSSLSHQLAQPQQLISDRTVSLMVVTASACNSTKSTLNHMFGTS